MRRDMAANIAQGNLGQARRQARCPRFARIVRRLALAGTPARPQPGVQCESMENQIPAKAALPLLALLALASALGIVVAIALAGVAILLAAPAYADEGEGGLMLERGVRLERAKLLFAESESEEDGHERVVEAYYNPFDEPLAGVYLYRLPPNAVLERLAFMPHAVEARHALLTRRQGTTLVERTAEIAPGETLVVELEYRRSSARRLLALREAVY
jgi:hypothetical protein